MAESTGDRSMEKCQRYRQLSRGDTHCFCLSLAFFQWTTQYFLNRSNSLNTGRSEIPREHKQSSRARVTYFLFGKRSWTALLNSLISVMMSSMADWSNRSYSSMASSALIISLLLSSTCTWRRLVIYLLNLQLLVVCV